LFSATEENVALRVHATGCSVFHPTFCLCGRHAAIIRRARTGGGSGSGGVCNRGRLRGLQRILRIRKTGHDEQAGRRRDHEA
jgi:hypothetical protein